LAALKRARAEWDKGNRHWWVRLRRVERLVADLEAVVDPLFQPLR